MWKIVWRIDATVTAGNGSERAKWMRWCSRGGFYVVQKDREGYVDSSLISGTA